MYKELILEVSQGSEFVKIQPPCPENEIDNAEKTVGYQFPKELRALLRELDGDKNLLLSAKEIIEQTELNREIQEEYKDEDYAKELNRFIFFATNGCGDYYCYYADSDGIVDETAIYIWEHEEFRKRKAASNIAELINRYYNGEI